MARIDAGKLDLSLEPVSLDEVVREVAVLMQPQAEQFDVAVDVAPIRAPARECRPAAPSPGDHEPRVQRDQVQPPRRSRADTR